MGSQSRLIVVRLAQRAPRSIRHVMRYRSSWQDEALSRWGAWPILCPRKIHGTRLRESGDQLAIWEQRLSGHSVRPNGA